LIDIDDIPKLMSLSTGSAHDNVLVLNIIVLVNFHSEVCLDVDDL
jgi:hypothetical protein